MGFFLPRQEILVPIGLVTQPNQYAQYPSGALRVARNVVMRNPGELVQAPDTTGQVTVGAANNILQQLFPLDSGHVYSFHLNGTTWSVFDNNNSAGLPLGISSTNLFSTTGRIGPTRNRERMIVNTLQGGLVVDYMAPTSAGERALRKAGMPQPGWRSISNVSTNAGAIPTGTMVGYVVCFARELQNGYTVRSVPSVPFKFANTSGVTLNPSLSIWWNSSSALLTTDKIEVYRTDGVPTAGFFGYQPDPGATFKLVKSVPITNPGNNNQTIEDTQPFVTGTAIGGAGTTAGRELYSNPGQEGATYTNRQPPIAQCCATFKGFTFYGNTTDRPKWTFSFPGGIGSESNGIIYGFTSGYLKAQSVGQKQITGTFTSGSANITGVAAADFVGLQAGMYWGGATPPWANTVTIQSLNSGAGTITLTANASSSSGAPVTCVFDEALEIDGFNLRYSDLYKLVQELQGTVTNVSAQFGKWEITADTNVAANITVFNPTATISIEPAYVGFDPVSFTVRGTHGDRFSPPIPDIAASVQTISAVTLKNHLVWSKEQQPEHVPAALETFVGNGEIIALVTTRDALWIWCTDGLYRLSGDGGADGLGFRVDLVDPSLILAAPQASCSLREIVYGYTNQGFVAVDSSGNLANLTDQRIGDLLPGARYTASRGIIAVANEADDEILLVLGENGNGNSDQVYCFNVPQNGWTTLSNNGATLSNLSSLAMQRDPGTGIGRILFGTTPLAGGTPSYSGWNSATTFLVPRVEYQPIYGDEPLSVKQWIWGDFLFATGSAAKTIQPIWNSTISGLSTIVDMENTGYGRAGIPRSVAISHTLSPGFTGLATTAPQTRFQGLSVAFKTLTNQSKRR